MQSRFLTLIIVPTNALKDQVVNDLYGMNLIVDSGFSNTGKVNFIVMTPASGGGFVPLQSNYIINDG
jgi:hypothetical protein